MNMFDLKETFEEKQYQEKIESINLLVESEWVPYPAKRRTLFDWTPLPTKRCSMDVQKQLHTANEGWIDCMGDSFLEIWWNQSFVCNPKKSCEMIG
jgi:hypothetical protein